MWLYIIGYIVSFVILGYLFYLLSNKLTYGNIIIAILVSFGSWISVVCEIVFILSFLIMSGIIILTESDFWNKEIFKKK